MSLIKIDKDTYFSTADGIVVSRANAVKLIQKAALLRRAMTLSPAIVHIKGQDSQVLNLQLVVRNDTVPPQRGFLVTVYLQDASGALQRLYREPIIDPADQSIARGSFEDYIHLEVDI